MKHRAIHRTVGCQTSARQPWCKVSTEDQSRAGESIAQKGSSGDILNSIHFASSTWTYSIYIFGCTWMDAALPSYSTVASGSEVDAIPVPCLSRTITIRKVLCSSIPGKLPSRAAIVTVEDLSSQWMGMTDRAPCS